MNRAIATAAAVLAGTLGPSTVWAAERGRAESGDTTAMLTGLGVVVLIVILASAVAWYVRRLERTRRSHSHPLLMKDLCKLHGLCRSERRLLSWVAQIYHLRYPSQLFLDPKWLDSENLVPALQPKAAELTAIRSRIFAEEPAAG